MDNFVGATPEQVLKDVFGYDSFRPLQKEIIENVLNRKDTLALLPTGGGKSLCYQIPALIFGGLTVVVSPLISLMQDQVQQLDSLGVPVAFLNSGLDFEEYALTMQKIRNGEVRLLYVSPEGLSTQRVLDLLLSAEVRFFTVDEAHCVSQWGHDFRPDYLEIARVRAIFPDAVFLALTATATKNVQNDIVRNLNLKNPAVLCSSFNRPNIFLCVNKKISNGFEQILDCISRHKNESGIVYCFSKRDVDTIAKALRNRGVLALEYHAGLSSEVRAENQERFLRDEVNVMVATIAFGMGINKPNVRFVIHHSMPKSIEQYYQEIGRAGRDGLSAEALLLYSYSDSQKIRFLLDKNVENQEERQKEEKLLLAMNDFVQTDECRRRALLRYFGEDFVPTESENCCDLCLRGKVQLRDLTVPAQKLMSCIIRTGMRFGSTYVIDVLRGSKQKRILERGHNKLSTFGIGTEFNVDGWKYLVDEMIFHNLLEKTGDFGILAITPRGMEILRNREKIELPFREEVVEKKLQKTISIFAQENDDSDSDEKQIFEALREWRLKIARSLKVAPFIIMHDKTFIDIARKKPQTKAELKNCEGLGAKKLEKYGDDILRIVRGD